MSTNTTQIKGKEHYNLILGGFAIVTLALLGFSSLAQGKAPLNNSKAASINACEPKAGTFTVPPSTVLSNQRLPGSNSRTVTLKVNGTGCELNLGGAPAQLSSFVVGKVVTFRANSDGAGNLSNPASIIDPSVVDTSTTETQSLDNNNAAPSNVANSVGSSEVTLPASDQYQAIDSSDMKTITGRVVSAPTYNSDQTMWVTLQTYDGNLKLNITRELANKLKLNGMQQFTITSNAIVGVQ